MVMYIYQYKNWVDFTCAFSKITVWIHCKCRKIFYIAHI